MGIYLVRQAFFPPYPKVWLAQDEPQRQELEEDAGPEEVAAVAELPATRIGPGWTCWCRRGS